MNYAKEIVQKLHNKENIFLTGGAGVGKTTLEAEISRGAALFAVNLKGVKELKAKAGCNLHGIWTSYKSL